MKCSDLQVGDNVRLKRTKEIVWVFEIDGSSWYVQGMIK